MIKRIRRWIWGKLWMRRNLALSAGTRAAMDYGNRIAKPPTPGLVRAVRLALENERRNNGA